MHDKHVILEKVVKDQKAIDGLLEAAKTLRLKTGTILTQHQEDEMKKDGVIIKLMPVWKWLLGV